MSITLDLALRNLRSHVRAPSWTLGRAALVLLVIAALTVAYATSARLAAPGLTFFSALLWIDFAFVTAIAIGPFASALADEKEGDTLGVLRLAGLTPSAVVAGKALGVLVSAVFLLGVQVPFAALAPTLGGMSWQQVGAAFVVLFAYVLAAQGIALAAAACSRTAKDAGTHTAWILVLWLGLPALLELLAAWVNVLGGGGGGGGGTPGTDALAELVAAVRRSSPLFVALPAFDQPSPPLFPPVVWLCLGVAVVGVSLAVRGIGRASVAHAEESRPSARRPRIVGLRTKALIWKEEHFLLGGARGMRRRLAGYVALLLLVGMFTYDPRGGWLASWGATGITIFFLVALLEAGVVASHLYREELRERTLFGLALLPIPPMTWATAKAQGGLRVIRAPLWMMAVCYVLAVAGQSQQHWWIVFAALLGAVAVTLTLYLSLWLPRGAFIAAVGIMALPALPFTIASKNDSVMMMCCSVYLGAPLAIVFVGWLQLQIGRRLRVLATRY